MGFFTAACSNHPTDEEQALASYVEKSVVLPKGAGSLQCYERYYVLLESDEANKRAGFDVPQRKLLIGDYILASDRNGGVAGIYWSKRKEDVPVMHDGGCSAIRVWYVPGVKPIATCSLDFAGKIPTVIEPPVAC